MKKFFWGVFVGILICAGFRMSTLVLFDWSYPTLGCLVEVYRSPFGMDLHVDLRPLNKKLKTILDEHRKKSEYDVKAFAYVFMHYDDSVSDEGNPVYMLIYDICITKVWEQNKRAALWNEIRDELQSTIDRYFEEHTPQDSRREYNGGCTLRRL